MSTERYAVQILPSIVMKSYIAAVVAGCELKDTVQKLSLLVGDRFLHYGASNLKKHNLRIAV